MELALAYFAAHSNVFHVNDAKKDLNDPWRQERIKELEEKGIHLPASSYDLFAEELKEREADKEDKSNPKDVWKGLSPEERDQYSERRKEMKEKFLMEEAKWQVAKLDAFADMGQKILKKKQAAADKATAEETAAKVKREREKEKKKEQVEASKKKQKAFQAPSRKADGAVPVAEKPKKRGRPAKK